MQAGSLVTAVDWAPPLTPKLAPWMRKLLNSAAPAEEILNRYGSPVHVVVGSEFIRNADDLLSPLRQREIAGGLYFARKANKLPWFVSLANEVGLGVDTASLAEVKETLALGVPGERVIVTAIGKSRELIEQSVTNGCLLVVDNFDELNSIQFISESLGLTARIGLRFSGFEIDGRKIFSRFGFPIQDCEQVLSVLQSRKRLQLELLHAHLDKYDPRERACALRELIALSDRAAVMGYWIKGLDVGGGIVIRYLDSSTQWEEFKEALVSSVKGLRPAFTYLSDGLGLHRIGDEIKGQPDLYPAWNAISKERFLAALLDNNEGGTTLHNELRERNLTLFCEPGRALLDNVGMTLARVTFRKRDSLGNLLIGLAMNRTNLRPFRSEFCSDPFLICGGVREDLDEGAYLVGNLCGEADTIFRRKLKLARLPEPGDIVAFANTGGYLSHHMEIGTHGDPLPRNVLIDPGTLSVQASI